MEMEICFVTSNKNKFREAKNIFDSGLTKRRVKLKQKKLEILEIQSLKVKDVVKHKAKKAYEQVRKPVVVEDTALYIKSWKNFPGPFISWVIKTMGIKGICRFVGTDRNATAEACVAYYDGKKMKIFSGKVRGKIARKPMGKKRFDWDRIFIPFGFSRTFAEMRVTEKNRISHRMKAFRKLEKYLKGLKKQI